jgi:glycosyltransferase involved in cell wall biosynthesis
LMAKGNAAPVGASNASLRVLLIEPYAAGSHRQWMQGLQAASNHEFREISQPGRFWKWRMHGAAPAAAQQLAEWSSDDGYLPDVVLASDMLDLAAFMGLARDQLHGVPAVLYMHENQLGYPKQTANPDWDASRRRRERPDMHYPFVNLTSMLAAQEVWWNSQHNLDSFLDALPGFLGGFPDERLKGMPEQVLAKSRIAPIGLDLVGLALQSVSDELRRERDCRERPVILWNHRWEHDKDPDAFFDALSQLDALDYAFDLVLVGESFARRPKAFESALERFGERILQYGHVEGRQEYEHWLLRSDIVISTARHEFFGAAVCEAVAAGCRPVLPARLAYPEIIPAQWHAQVLYETQEGLVPAMQRALGEWRSAAHHRLVEDLQASLLEYDWFRMAPQYDRALEALHHQRPTPFEPDESKVRAVDGSKRKVSFPDEGCPDAEN